MSSLTSTFVVASFASLTHPTATVSHCAAGRSPCRASLVLLLDQVAAGHGLPAVLVGERLTLDPGLPAMHRRRRVLLGLSTRRTDSLSAALS